MITRPFDFPGRDDRIRTSQLSVPKASMISQRLFVVFLKHLLENIIHLFNILHNFSGCPALQT